MKLLLHRNLYIKVLKDYRHTHTQCSKRTENLQELFVVCFGCQRNYCNSYCNNAICLNNSNNACQEFSINA